MDVLRQVLEPLSDQIKLAFVFGSVASGKESSNSDVDLLLVGDIKFSEAVSNETRFDAAYKAIMQLANAALQANGFRTLTSKPGHHMTLIQVTLCQASATGDCVRQAENLLETVKHWLKDNKSELLE